MKQVYAICFSLIIGTSLHAMEQAPVKKMVSAKRQVLSSKDCLMHITQQLCTRNSRLSTITNTIKSLSLVNKRLQKYYNDSSRRKTIVRTIALHKKVSDLIVAQALAYRAMATKIENFFAMAKASNISAQQLSHELKKNKWYINATVAGEGEEPIFQQQTLLHITAAAMNVEKTKALIGMHCDCDARCLNPIALLAGPNPVFHDYQIFSPQGQRDHFALLTLFLQAQGDPDSRCAITSYTFLHRAAHNDDKERAKLLLTFGANPFKLFFDDFYKQYNSDDVLDQATGKYVKWSHPKFRKCIKTSKKLPLDTLYLATDNRKEPWKNNAFTLERGEPKGWLKAMYDEINSLKTTHSPADQSVAQ